MRTLNISIRYAFGNIYSIPPFLDHDCNLEPTKNHVSRHRSGHGGATAGESSKVKTTTFSENSPATATNAIFRYKVFEVQYRLFLIVSYWIVSPGHAHCSDYNDD